MVINVPIIALIIFLNIFKQELFFSPQIYFLSSKRIDITNTVKTIREMLDYLISLSDMKNQILIEEDPGRLRPIDADLQIPNTKKFVEATGWKPEYSFEDTMQDLLNYWRKAVSVRRYLSR